jgi:hypothetical protein
MNKFKDIINEEVINRAASTVIPAWLESFLKKDAGQAGMTEMRILIHV